MIEVLIGRVRREREQEERETNMKRQFGKSMRRQRKPMTDPGMNEERQ